MKNFMPVLVIQVVAVLAAVSALMTVISAVALCFVMDTFLVLLLVGSLPILVFSVLYLRYKKITRQEFLECLWPLGMPW